MLVGERHATWRLARSGEWYEFSLGRWLIDAESNKNLHSMLHKALSSLPPLKVSAVLPLVQVKRGPENPRSSSLGSDIHSTKPAHLLLSSFPWLETSSAAETELKSPMIRHGPSISITSLFRSCHRYFLRAGFGLP